MPPRLLIRHRPSGATVDVGEACISPDAILSTSLGKRSGNYALSGWIKIDCGGGGDEDQVDGEDDETQERKKMGKDYAFMFDFRKLDN